MMDKLKEKYRISSKAEFLEYLGKVIKYEIGDKVIYRTFMKMQIIKSIAINTCSLNPEVSYMLSDTIGLVSQQELANWTQERGNVIDRFHNLQEILK